MAVRLRVEGDGASGVAEWWGAPLWRRVVDLMGLS